MFRTLLGVTLALLALPASAAFISFDGFDDEGAHVRYMPNPNLITGVRIPADIELQGDDELGTLAIARWDVYDTSGALAYSLGPQTPTLAFAGIRFEGTITTQDGPFQVLLFPAASLGGSWRVSINPETPVPISAPLLAGQPFTAFTLTNLGTSQIPEPGALVLFVAGIFTWTLRRRRMWRTKQTACQGAASCYGLL